MIDFALLRALGATLAIGYDPFERAWHVAVSNDKRRTVEAAGDDPQALADQAIQAFAAQPVAAEPKLFG